MKYSTQVFDGHYDFSKYVSKRRWNSIWHQLNEVLLLSPSSVLEVGPGSGVFKSVASLFNVEVETIDIDAGVSPDYVASATEMPFPDNVFDVVCAFQVLEHLPYDESLKAIAEIARVGKKKAILSLPDCKPIWQYSIHLPKLGKLKFDIPRPLFRAPRHSFDGEHYWEINKEEYPLSRIVADLSKHASVSHTYRVEQNPYHRFFILEL